MKHIKKMLAAVLACAMVMAMGIGAFAAGHGTITINNAVADHTYTAYQILKGDVANGKLSNVTWGDGITDAGKTALYTKYSLTGADQTAAKVAEAIAASTAGGAATTGDSKAIEFANTVGTNVTGGKAGTVSDTTCTISDLDDGYYMIVDTWAGAATAVQDKDYTLSRYMVQLVGTATVNNKADKPTVDKEIVDDNASTDKNANTANIGDTVSYKVTSKVPEYDGYKEYYMDFKDTLSKGLTFVAEPDNTSIEKGVTVKIGGTQLAPDAYDVTVGEYNETTGTDITIHLKDLKSRKYTVGADIEITYSATVNDKAVIGNAGNPNTVKLEYSNKPDNSGDGTPDNDNDGVKGETPSSEVKTFVTEIELTKVSKDTARPLEGAVFNVKGTQINKVLVTGQEFVQDNDTGTYYKLTDGTYTTKAPTPQTANQYVDSTGATKYKKADYATTSVKETANVDFQVISGADGKIKITGLKEGTYTFTEIQAPDGYNLLDGPITVVVDSNIATITKPDEFAWSKGANTPDSVTVDENGTFKFNVENAEGTELPSTGGIGTTIFYVVGTILVLGAGVLLVTKRRMRAE